jgi:hypothetical protein
MHKRKPRHNRDTVAFPIHMGFCKEFLEKITDLSCLGEIFSWSYHGSKPGKTCEVGPLASECSYFIFSLFALCTQRESCSEAQSATAEKTNDMTVNPRTSCPLLCEARGRLRRWYADRDHKFAKPPRELWRRMGYAPTQC